MRAAKRAVNLSPQQQLNPRSGPSAAARAAPNAGRNLTLPPSTDPSPRRSRKGTRQYAHLLADPRQAGRTTREGARPRIRYRF